MNKDYISWSRKKIINNVTPFTLLDFQGYPSAIIWFSGCNMRCDFCYNPEIVLNKGKLGFEDIKDFFVSRKNLLKGAVLCGGEPTVYKELFNICESLKDMAYKIKLDTNGLNTDLIQSLIQNKLVDFIALDFKAPEEKFKTVTKSDRFEKFEETLDFLINSQIDYEVRTTFSQELLFVEDIYKMIDFLTKKKYDKTYYLQNFLSSKETLGKIKNSNSVNLSRTVKQNYPFEIKFRNF